MTRMAFGGYEMPPTRTDPRDDLESRLAVALYDEFGPHTLSAIAEELSAADPAGPLAELAEAARDAAAAAARQPELDARYAAEKTAYDARHPSRPVPFSVYASDDPDAEPLEVLVNDGSGERRATVVPAAVTDWRLADGVVGAQVFIRPHA